MDQKNIIEVAMAYPIDEIIGRYAEEQELALPAAAEHAREAKRFLTLCALHPDRTYGMRGPIDEFWHTFVTFTSRYMDFCERVAGRFIHHFPNTEPKARARYSFNRGRRGGPPKKESKENLQQLYLDMLRDYEATFGEPAPQHLWPRPSATDDNNLTRCSSIPCRCGCRCIA